MSPRQDPTALPLIAGCAGTYSESGSLPGLEAHFQCVWSNSVHAEHPGGIAVVPDGCIDLIWRGDRLFVAGPDVTAAHPDLRPGETVLGLRFRPGAAVRWLGLAMSEIVGCQIDLRDVWGGRARQISELMLEASGAGGEARVLQQELSRMAAAIEVPAREAEVIFGFLRNGACDGETSVQHLRRWLGLSERTLRRRSDHLFGYGPKTLHRILRFQAFQALVRSCRASPLADLAAWAGYSDQAHLNREIRALCGLTAGQFLGQLRN